MLDEQNNEQKNLIINQYELSIDDAEIELLSALDAYFPQTKGEPKREIADRYSQGGVVRTKTGKEEQTPLVHIFNFKDDMGFAIMSGDCRFGPVLCITDKGSLKEGSQIDNPGFAGILSRMETNYRIKTGLPVYDEEGNPVVVREPEIVRDLQDTSGNYVPPVTLEYGPWEIDETIGTKLTCHWDQESTFNDNLYVENGNHAYTGCTTIAVAQIMYHWGKNTTYNGTYFDWQIMRTVQNSWTESSTARSMVAHLIEYLCAPENLDADLGEVYNAEGTAVNRNDTPRTFENFGYSSGGAVQDYDYLTLKSSMGYGPALGHGHAKKTITSIFGITISTSYSEGHSWVFDEIRINRRIVYRYIEDWLDYTYYQYQPLIHINWGWGGSCDGYFNTNCFNANNPVTRSDTTTYGTDDYYQYNLGMNCGIRAY